MNIASIVASNLNLAWSLLEEQVRGVVFKRISGYSISSGVAETIFESAACDVLSVNYSSRDVDGSSIVNGDEKWLVRASDLSDLTGLPASGDWFEESGIRHDILAANREATQSLWIFQVRRQIIDPSAAVDGSEDWGLVSEAHTETEDWGSLALHDSDEDWMT